MLEPQQLLTLTVTWGSTSGLIQVAEADAIGCEGTVVTFAVTVNTSTLFRSIATGDWDVTTTWESSCDGSSWINAITTPDNTDGTITIRSPHTVTITAAATIDELTIDPGGTLNHQGSNNLTINDGTGVDLTVNGTFEDNVTSTYQITWLGSSSWVMGANGTLIRTRTSSSNDWRDHYDGGIINIPATAYSILRRSTGGPYLSSVGGMYYPNLTIENNTGTPWVVAGTSSFTGASDYPRIKGSFNIGGSGSNTVDFLCDNTNANEVPVQGDLIIADGSALRNYGTGFNIEGNLSVVGPTGNGITYDADGSRNLK